MKRVTALFLFTGLAFAQRQVQEFDTSAGALKITPIQHASLVIEAGGKVVYLDPVSGGNFSELPPADLILITDIHGDHMDPKILPKISKSGTKILAPAAVAETVKTATVIRNGETVHEGPFTIEGIPMYNLKRGPEAGKLFHDKGRGNGYVITYGGKRFYFSGDTENIPEMRALENIDVAFVCMNLPYTMPPEEAAEAVRAFHPKIVYPYHYRGSDLNVFKNALAGTGIDVRILDWYYKS
jgi:L-ascorbate metabolism protein UlaG (beta-lactamase superfamily)